MPGDGRSVAEWEVLNDAIGVGLVHNCSFAEPAATFRVLTGEQVPSASVGAQHFAGGGDFEAFGHRFARFAACNGLRHKVRSIAQLAI